MVGRQIRRLRRIVGLSGSELDRLAGLARGHSANIETRWPNPRVATLVRIATVFGVSVELLTGNGGPLPSKDDLTRAVATARRKVAA